MVLLITTDLLASSQVEGAARSVGVSLEIAGPKAAREKVATVRLVVLDLASPLGDLPTLVAQLKSLESAPAVIAFGPHVHEQKLQAAAEAGCDEVLTRGQFHRSAAAVIARYVEAEADSSSE